MMRALMIGAALWCGGLLAAAQADEGMDAALSQVRQCLLDHDRSFCHETLTPDSRALYDRFDGYGLTECLPADFRTEQETMTGNEALATLRVQGPRNKEFLAKLVFLRQGREYKLDLPATFRRGLGPDWKNKIDGAEQIYLFMRQQMGGHVECSALTGLIKAR